MLPMPSGGGRARMQLRMLDYDHALWQMMHLILQPRRVVRSATYHRNTKHQWARDDPAFLLVLAAMLAVAATAWAVTTGHYSPVHSALLAAYALLVDLLLVGAVVSTACWYLANTYMLEGGAPGGAVWSAVSAVEPDGRHPADGVPRDVVEWLYAFDVHCNSFFLLFLVLYAGQLLLLPLLLREGFFPALLSNALYAGAFAVYHYVTFLGYSELPFLRHTEAFGYALILVALAFLVSIPAAAISGFSATHLAMSIYFPDWDWAGASSR